MTFQVEITLKRSGYIIEIVGCGVAVDFLPQEYTKTLSTIFEKILELQPDLKLEQNKDELKYQQESAQAQLTEIYKEYHLEQLKSSNTTEQQGPKNFRKSDNSSAENRANQAQEDDDPIAQSVESLMDNYTFKTLTDTEEILYYNKSRGIFVNGGDIIIKSKAEEQMQFEISNKKVNEILGHIQRQTYTDRTEFDKDIQWLACKNCMINLKTLETRSHSPDFMATLQIPVYYEASSFITDFFEWVEGDGAISCPCPKIIKFLYEVIAAQDVETVLDVIAYSLWRAFPFHRYVLFNGAGRNGKGTLLYVISKLLGSGNISGESLQRILETKFAVAELYGKLANIDADLSSEALANTGILKKLTGGDSIAAERKFLHPFKFVNYAKLWFSANEIPKTPDETDAFFARLIIINFPHQFLGDEVDHDLKYKLTTDQELSGLLRLVIKRLPKVLQNGIYVPNSTIQENYDKYIESSDPVRAFVDQMVDRDMNSGPLKDEVYEAYKQFCNDKKLPIESSPSFSRRLKKEHGFEDVQLRSGNGSKPWFWKGLKVKVKVREQGQSTIVE